MKQTTSGNFLENYLTTQRDILQNLPLDAVQRVAEILWEAYQKEHMIFAFGNGGSSAMASHFTQDLMKDIVFPPGRPRFRALALTDSVPLITAWANDTSYENVFAEQLRNFLQPVDVAVAFSGSGNSPNVLRALEVAREGGATTVALGGRAGGKMKALAQEAILVPSDSIQQIQDAHHVIMHLLCLQLKKWIEECRPEE